MQQVVIATHNQGKMEEFKVLLEALGLDFCCLNDFPDIPEPEETGKTFAANARLKATYYAKATGRMCLADDSGLEIDYLNKEPGVYSARYMGHDTSYDIKNAALLKRLEGVEGNDRSGRFVCAIAVCFPDGREIVKRGTMEGPIVYLPEYGKTSAELDPEEKNRISHRGKALALIKEVLDKSEDIYAEDNDNK